MQRLIHLSFVIFSVNSFAAVDFKFKTDFPEFSQTVDLGPSDLVEDQKRHVKLTCEVFSEFVMLTVNDPGLKGAGYQILPRKKGEMNGNAICGAVKKPKEFTFWGGPVEGVIGLVVVYRGEEPLGELDHLTFFDVKNKKSLFGASFNTSAPFLIEKTGKTIGLKYESFLEYPTPRCNPVLDADGSCLKNILKNNGISKASHLASVDCSKAIQENANDAKDGSVHLFIETQVKNIRKPIKQVIGQKITCTLSP